MGMDALNSVNFQNQGVTKAAPEAPAAPVAQSASVAGISASMNAAATKAQNQTKEQYQPTDEEIQNAITSANKRGATFGNTSAQFSYDKETHRISVKLTDKETHEVIKEIPSEETLEMISKMWELAGIMIDEKR